MATQSLIIKDGTGAIKSLTVESSSYGFIPVHHVTSALESPIYIINPPATTVTQQCISSFDYETNDSGTFVIASNNSSRKGLTVFNPGPNPLYISLSSDGNEKNGFTLIDINSAPSFYSFILFPSGTYIADQTTLNVYHGGYFISGSTSNVFISLLS